MKKRLPFFIIIVVLISCSKQSELIKNFNCKTSISENITHITDFKNNFKLKLPTNWKRKMYYGNYQSEIFTADTTKQLTDSFILVTSFNLGNLNFNEFFYQKNDSVLKASGLYELNSGTTTFQSKPAFWYVAKGSKNNFKYQTFNITVKLSESSYFNAYSEIYGEEHIEERICKSIAFIETVEFSQ